MGLESIEEYGIKVVEQHVGKVSIEESMEMVLASTSSSVLVVLDAFHLKVVDPVLSLC